MDIVLGVGAVLGTLAGVAAVVLMVVHRNRDIAQRAKDQKAAENQAEHDSVAALLTFLENRRVLFIPWQWEAEHQDRVVDSVLEIRKRLTGDLEQLRAGSSAIEPVASMQNACLVFVTRIPHAMERKAWEVEDALEALRQVFLAQTDFLYGEFSISPTVRDWPEIGGRVVGIRLEPY